MRMENGAQLEPSWGAGASKPVTGASPAGARGWGATRKTVTSTRGLCCSGGKGVRWEGFMVIKLRGYKGVVRVGSVGGMVSRRRTAGCTLKGFYRVFGFLMVTTPRLCFCVCGLVGGQRQ